MISLPQLRLQLSFQPRSTSPTFIAGVLPFNTALDAKGILLTFIIHIRGVLRPAFSDIWATLWHYLTSPLDEYTVFHGRCSSQTL